MEYEGIDIYNQTRVCDYKGRRYHVRDNGAIYRQCKEDGKQRKWDEEWTFGNPDVNTGYLMIGAERVHRIVCTAFHGEPEGDKNIVDHIDTNRQNNRPDNLRWVTKLDNAINNPITRAKIELICGSIEAFIENPSLLRGYESENPNFGWMRQVTPEEAKASYQRWLEWASKPIEQRKAKAGREGLGEWLYARTGTASYKDKSEEYQTYGYKSWAQQKAEIEEINRRIYEEQHGLKDSLTPGAKQLNWVTPTEFLLCPPIDQERSLQSYLSNLTHGKTFARTQYGDGGTVLEADYNPNDDALYILTGGINTVTSFALCKISFADDSFIHENLGSFMSEEGGRKYYTLAMGQEWTGGDVIDDYC